MYPGGYVYITFVLFNKAPNHMSSDADNSNMSRKSHKVLPLSEKMKAIYLMRKEKNHMQLLGFPVRTNLLSMKL